MWLNFQTLILVRSRNLMSALGAELENMIHFTFLIFKWVLRKTWRKRRIWSSVRKMNSHLSLTLINRLKHTSSNVHKFILNAN